ncbi:hypothetical protein [Actinomadura macra]|uniref:hypothetical protein n=1 Tax=Actinomadura macra TaxID=46164 RepID=UPI000ABD403A|nr:hypothetical protein [Actinomadura macra]
MANNTKVKVFKVRGFTDEVTACQICGREELKGTVVLRELDAEGNEFTETYAGTGCAAEVGGWTQRAVKAELKALQQAKRDADRAARDAEWSARTDRETAEMIEWAAEVYGIQAKTRDELFEAVRRATGRRGPATALILFREYKQAQKAATNRTEETVKNWTDMTAADFYADGVQMDLLAGIEGDGYGTLDLLDTSAEVAPVVEPAERADGALFGFTDGPAVDGALFSVVAA